MSKQTLPTFLILTLVFCCFASAKEPGLQRYRVSSRQMGSLFLITLYAPDKDTARKATDAAFDRVEALNEIFSDYDPDSEASQLSLKAPTTKAVPVSNEMWKVLGLATELNEKTKGAFDVTVGPLTRLWRAARRSKKLPDAEQLKQAKLSVGRQLVKLHPDKQAVTLSGKSMQLDFGGIAKGYAADEALVAMKKFGVTRAIVNAGGDVAIGDPPPDKKGWRIGVAPLKPRDEPSHMLVLSHCGVATSGDAWQFVEVAGKRYSHIVDPKTGLGLTDRSGVTVVASNCTQADSLASAVSVLGPKKGVALIETEKGAACLVIRAEAEESKVYKSSRFDSLVQGQG